MPSATQAIGTNLFRGNQTDLVNFTNAASGVGGLHLTNTIHQLTNGSTTITSQWVRLRGSGATLWAKFSTTNALITNCVAEFQVSPDGTNASSSTILLNSMSSGAIAAGQWIASSNLPITLVGNIECIRLYKVHFTNGANTVGSVFSTNTGPTFAVSQLKE